MIITLYYNQSPANYVNKVLTSSLYTDISVVNFDTDNPTVRVEHQFNYNNMLKQMNYVRLQINNQTFYYFITKMNWIENRVVEISLHIDVLMSYREQLLAQSAIIDRQENDWNLFIQDPMLQVYQNQIVQQKLFPNKIDNNNFILTVAGG